MIAARFAGIRRLSKQNKSVEQKNAIHPRRGSNTSDSGSGASSPRRMSLLQVPAVPRRRAGSVPIVRSSLAAAWGIKPDQCRALRITWSRLCDTPGSSCKGIVAIVDYVFERFDEKNKQVRETFYNAAFVDSMADRSQRRRSIQQYAPTIATLRDHTHFFVSLISQVINSIDTDSQETLQHIDRIGSSHAQLKQYGFRDSMWDQLGELVIDAFVVQDCVRGFPDACRAWTILIAKLTDRLRAGRANIPNIPYTSSEHTKLAVRPGRTTRSPSLSPGVLRGRTDSITSTSSFRRRPSRAVSMRVPRDQAE